MASLSLTREPEDMKISSPRGTDASTDDKTSSDEDEFLSAESGDEDDDKSMKEEEPRKQETVNLSTDSLVGRGDCTAIHEIISSSEEQGVETAEGKDETTPCADHTLEPYIKPTEMRDFGNESNGEQPQTISEASNIQISKVDSKVGAEGHLSTGLAYKPTATSTEFEDPGLDDNSEQQHTKGGNATSQRANEEITSSSTASTDHSNGPDMPKSCAEQHPQLTDKPADLSMGPPPRPARRNPNSISLPAEQTAQSPPKPLPRRTKAKASITDSSTAKEQSDSVQLEMSINGSDIVSPGQCEDYRPSTDDDHQSQSMETARCEEGVRPKKSVQGDGEDPNQLALLGSKAKEIKQRDDSQQFGPDGKTEGIHIHIYDMFSLYK